MSETTEFIKIYKEMIAEANSHVLKNLCGEISTGIDETVIARFATQKDPFIGCNIYIKIKGKEYTYRLNDEDPEVIRKFIFTKTAEILASVLLTKFHIENK